MTYQVRKFSKVSISTVHPRKYRKDFLLQEEGMESLNLSLRPFPLLVSRRPIFLQRDRLWCPASGSMLTKLSTRKEAWRMEKSLSVLRQFWLRRGFEKRFAHGGHRYPFAHLRMGMLPWCSTFSWCSERIFSGDAFGSSFTHESTTWWTPRCRSGSPFCDPSTDLRTHRLRSRIRSGCSSTVTLKIADSKQAWYTLHCTTCPVAMVIASLCLLLMWMTCSTPIFQKVKRSSQNSSRNSSLVQEVDNFRYCGKQFSREPDGTIMIGVTDNTRVASSSLQQDHTMRFLSRMISHARGQHYRKCFDNVSPKLALANLPQFRFPSEWVRLLSHSWLHQTSRWISF